MRISARIPQSTETAQSITKNGFVFKLMPDKYYYTNIYPKQKQYLQKLFKNVEFIDYEEPKRRTRAKKADAVSN